MRELTILNQDPIATITSLELLEQINFFREQEGKKKELRHDTLLNIIRDEFDEEIRAQKILESLYKAETGNGTLREYPMYILTYNQAKQVLMRESKYVRKRVIEHIEKLEECFKVMTKQTKNIELEELKQKINNLEKMISNTLIETSTMSLKKYIANRGVNNNINTNILASKASAICKKKGIKLNKTLEPQYKLVNSYPVHILDTIYAEMLESNKEKSNVMNLLVVNYKER